MTGCDDSSPTPPPNGDVEPSLELVVDGLSGPTHLSAPPGDADRLFIVEQEGRVRIVREGTLLSEPFLDISSNVRTGGERGLFSIAFHPDYASNGYFFVNYTDDEGDTRVERYTVASDPDVADPASASLILGVDQPYGNHNGGQLAFGPDGMLYIGMGDGGDGDGPADPEGNGQNPETLLGSILRIDVDGGTPYAIPADNPFATHESYAPETWAYGLRNPWRFSFDRQTGDLYIADVGDSDKEEVSFQPAASGGGENYGWSIMEGTDCFDPPSDCDQSGLVLPVYEYSHPEGCSITGGFVYRGTELPELSGRYFFGDFCGGWIRSFRVEDGEAVDVVDHEPDFGTLSQLSSFGEDALGQLYVMTLDGELYRLTVSEQ